MSSPYVGEIRMFAGNFAPAGWAMCQGQLMPISQQETLFNLIGTTYGGDGQETFGIPNFSGRIPIHMGTGSGLSTYQIGESAGVESVTLTVQQIPQHNHAAMCNTAAGNQNSPSNGIWAQSSSGQYGTGAPNTNMAALQPAGGSQPHENMMPYLCVSFILSLFGIFPTQN
jgi:microcystin-dependent protein